MLGEDASRLVLALTFFTAACGPTPPPDVPVAVIAIAPAAPSTPVVAIPPRPDGPPDAQVAAFDDARAERDPRASMIDDDDKGRAPRGPRAATLEALRFPPARRTPRASALLSTELRGLVALFNSAPRGAPDRPSYLKVVTYPPPENDVYGYALLRLGAVNENQGNVRHAHLVNYKLRKGAATHPDWDIFTVPLSLLPVGAP